MRILVIGGDSRLGQALLPKIKEHDVMITTKDDYDLSELSNKFLGVYDVVVLLACDFKSGRPDSEQAKCWNTNVVGVKNALSNIKYNRVVFISSYLSNTETAYGRQKAEIENHIKLLPESYCILRPNRIKDFNAVADKIVEGINDNENWCCNTSL